MYCDYIDPKTNKPYADEYCCNNGEEKCPMEEECTITTNITNAYTHGNGIYDLGRDELAFKTKTEKMILPIGTLVTYERFGKELKMGVIAEDDRGNSEEDLSDLNYCIITPEDDWNWDKCYMDHHTCIVKVHGMANVMVRYANNRVHPHIIGENRITL